MMMRRERVRTEARQTRIISLYWPALPVTSRRGRLRVQRVSVRPLSVMGGLVDVDTAGR